MRNGHVVWFRGKIGATCRVKGRFRDSVNMNMVNSCHHKRGMVAAALTNFAGFDRPFFIHIQLLTAEQQAKEQLELDLKPLADDPV